MVSEYDPKIFDGLNDLKINSRSVLEGDLMGIGKLAIKFKVAVVSHRHFGLEKNEVMLEVVEEDGDFVSSPYSLAKIQEVGAKPCLISLDGKGEWHPVGYGFYDDQPFYDKKFLQEVKWYFMTHDLSNKLLLGLRPTPNNDLIHVQTYDNSNHEAISQPCLPDKLPNRHLIKTAFSFEKNCDGEPTF